MLGMHVARKGRDGGVNGRVATRLLAGAATGLGAVALGWGGYAAVTWLRYGTRRADAPPDALLDRFIPEFEAGDVHQVRVAAPAEIALQALKEMDLDAIPLVHAIFRARELILASEPAEAGMPRGILASTVAMGWGVLAEEPGREVVVGAVTRPWEADVTFHALSPDAFRDYAEPGWVKIAWTLQAEPAGPAESIARTEVRVTTTDAVARSRFRRYWAVFSPGIHLIRRLALPRVRDEAERRYRESTAPQLAADPPAASGPVLA